MSGKLRHPGWLLFASLLFAAQAFGQFEVSPDHFDDSATQATHKVQHKKTVRQQATAGKAAPGVVTKQKQLSAKRQTNQPAHADQRETKTVAQAH